MRKELREKLMKKFPWVEARNVFSGERLGYAKGFECGDGWYQLIHDMFQEIDDLYKVQGEDPMEIQILQIKEKWAELRVHLGNYIEEVDEIVQKYEEKSTSVCEVCGESGAVKGEAWYKTLCDECEVKS